LSGRGGTNEQDNDELNEYLIVLKSLGQHSVRSIQNSYRFHDDIICWRDAVVENSKARLMIMQRCASVFIYSSLNSSSHIINQPSLKILCCTSSSMCKKYWTGMPSRYKKTFCVWSLRKCYFNVALLVLVLVFFSLSFNISNTCLPSLLLVLYFVFFAALQQLDLVRYQAHIIAAAAASRL